jgi:polysaccharide export outer membrane protein
MSLHVITRLVAAFWRHTCVLSPRGALAVAIIAGAAPQLGAQAPAAAGNYVLQAGDIVRVQVYQEPDLDRELRVSQEGTVSLPLIGNVAVAGRSLALAEAEIARLYDADFLVNPQVSVSVLRYAERRINIIGAVNMPGPVVIPPEEKMTLLEAITRAGGFNRLADKKRVRLTRSGADGQKQNFTIDANTLITGTNSEEWILQPGDTVFVPEGW